MVVAGKRQLSCGGGLGVEGFSAGFEFGESFGGTAGAVAVAPVFPAQVIGIGVGPYGALSYSFTNATLYLHLESAFIKLPCFGRAFFVPTVFPSAGLN